METMSPDSRPAPAVVRPPELIRLPESLLRWLRQQVQSTPAWVVLVQLFIGLGWARAAVEKVVDGRWWSGEVIVGFVSTHDGDSLAWYRPFLDLVVGPNAAAFALLVVALQLFAAATLLSNRRVGLGLAVGMFLNLHFVLAGAVEPSIFYLICQGALGLRLLEVGQAKRSTSGMLDAIDVSCLSLAMLSAPLISTLHPAEVIEDPAIIVVTFAALLLAANAALRSRLRSGLTHAPTCADDQCSLIETGR